MANGTSRKQTNRTDLTRTYIVEHLLDSGDWVPFDHNILNQVSAVTCWNRKNDAKPTLYKAIAQHGGKRKGRLRARITEVTP